MKILTANQVREADQYTIANEPISSIDLMERASKAFVTKFLGLHPEKQKVSIFCGTGNNGGDGLAIGRLLIDRRWEVSVFVIGNLEKGSDDFKANLNRLDSYQHIDQADDFPLIPSDSIIVDGLFGSGLSREVEGIYAELITYLNDQNGQRVAIDIASGLFANEPLSNAAIAFCPDYTLSFQTPKLSFFLPEYEKYVGEWRVLDIGLSTSFIRNQSTEFYLSEADELSSLLPERSTFTHKGKVGRLMIVAGSKGKMGAAVLCTRAAFRAGAGLVNVHSPNCGIEILQISIPEAMVSLDSGEEYIESIPLTDDTVAIGPGLDQNEKTVKTLRAFLQAHDKPVVIDADGINILAENEDILKLLPKDSVLTPHPGEFRRLVGAWKNDYEKLDKLKSFCKKYEVNLVLKGAFSAVCTSEGIVFFNPSGNPGLATAGSGDVLTGIIAALLAQGLLPINALRLGVFLHGQSGDEAVREMQTPWIQASDIIDFIPNAVSSLMTN